MAKAQPVARWFTVGAMGRQPHLRNILRAAGTARDRGGPERAVGAARGRVAQIEAERRWRMGRELSQRQGPELARTRNKHGLANGVGAHRAAGGRSTPALKTPARG